MDTGWRKYFRFDRHQPREPQVEALDNITAAFDHGKSVVLFEGPTGLGKSAIADVLARMYGSAYIVTADKLLQEQYEQSFPGGHVMLQGKANYPCANPNFTDANFTCGSAPCNQPGEEAAKIRAICIKGRICPYYLARERAVEASSTILNFANFATLGQLGLLPEREIIVIDECHRLEEAVIESATIEITPQTFSTLPSLRSIIYELPSLTAMDAAETFLRERVLPRLQGNIDGSVNAAQEPKYLSILEKIERFLNHPDKSHFVVVSAEPGFKIKPLTAAEAMQNLLRLGKKVLLMSATVLDESVVCEPLGIKPAEVTFVRAFNTFHWSNRPVVFDPAGSMRSNEIKGTLPYLCEKITEILACHPEEKGLIHCQNYQIAEAIASYLPENDRLLIQSSPAQRKTLLKRHIRSSEPTVLVSPGMREGIDLKDDLSRFQILCKVPFPYLGDPWTSRRMEISNEWYAWKTAIALVQSVGRSVRAADDHAVTYMLDEDFMDFQLRWSRFLPSYFREACVSSDELHFRYGYLRSRQR